MSMRQFLWGTSHKYHLLSWERVCLPKPLGGLGIRMIKEVNVSLLGKWLWRLADNEEGLWKAVIKAKYLMEPMEWCSSRRTS
ncbi:hypothetical protein FRX31_017930 [Thalictrum thalictroides]|uniref:Uncharacterized protein n=1 Tax=Thalictrum thalictroides TaxID=46969 RepID=A0A7J6W622_THATH|nr:hypothetical protein FRX31_017930 [Thalictrum thalictroides]